MRLIIACLMLPLLSACVPAVFVAGATAGGALVYDQRDAKTQLRDRDIAQIAHNRLSSARSLKGAHIEVAVYNGVVLLVGQVTAPEQRDQAYQLVSSIPPVSRVYNEVTVSDTTNFFDKANDDYTTTKVKTALLAEKGLKSTDIKVVTESGVVYLMGLVTPAEGEKAASVASRIKGVTKVVKVFQYQN